jgi:CheY-like chemotaxis protein
MDVKILAAEDHPKHYNNLVSILNAIPREDKAHWGIDNLKFTSAASATKAVAQLEIAANRKTPYDILVLDLNLPVEEGGIEDIEHGFGVLTSARKLKAAKQTVIFTMYGGGENILRSLREGASDFFVKPGVPGYDEQELQTRFMGCWKSILENESASLLDQRIKDLVPYAEAGLAQRFTACFTDFLQKVAHTSEDIEHYAYERFGIDRANDPQDYLILSLERQEADLKGARTNWSGLNTDMLGDTSAGKTMKLVALLNPIREKLSPCLIVKNTSLLQNFSDAGETGVLTFQDDARVIMQEITAGALSTLQDYGAKHTIEITATVDDGQAEIRFVDDLEQQISVEDAQAINNGSIVSPEHGLERFGRAWGLSVAQHVALRGGGRLMVKPQPAGRGNVITYFAPLAQSAEDAAPAWAAALAV